MRGEEIYVCAVLRGMPKRNKSLVMHQSEKLMEESVGVVNFRNLL
jgi:hypothetical protein